MVNNKEVRAAISEAGLKHWQVAEKMGVSDFTFSVWLRHELPEEKKTKILETIKEMTKDESWI